MERRCLSCREFFEEEEIIICNCGNKICIDCLDKNCLFCPQCGVDLEKVYDEARVLIPINMRDGSILAVGKGNPDWNFSAPHGAGRIMSRGQAKQRINMEEYQETMRGIYTTSVNRSTLDEAPMSYKPMEEILNNIGDTVEVLGVIKPVYNFKAGE